jgi:hypothetical protein
MVRWNAGSEHVKTQRQTFLFGGNPPRELALVGTKAVPSGVIISTYRPNGPLRTGTFDDATA